MIDKLIFSRDQLWKVIHKKFDETYSRHLISGQKRVAKDIFRPVNFTDYFPDTDCELVIDTDDEYLNKAFEKTLYQYVINSFLNLNISTTLIKNYGTWSFFVDSVEQELMSISAKNKLIARGIDEDLHDITDI